MKKRLLPPAFLAAASVVGGGIWFASAEHLPVITGMYWALTTAATVGYGDITPHGAHGRLVASLVMLVAIPSLGAVFGILAGGHIMKRMAPHNEAMREDAAAARRIAADLHQKLTGDRHPDAPGKP